MRLFYDHLKVQLEMDYGCSIDEQTDLQVRLFYRHLLQLRLRLGLDCSTIPPLDLWYMRSAALWNEYSVLCAPTFDEMIIYIEPDYQETLTELRRRTDKAAVCFENYQLKNLFGRLSKSDATVFGFIDPRYKDNELQLKFEKLLQTRDAVKMRFQPR